MCEPSEEHLLQKILEFRHQDSFESLIRPYVKPLQAIIRNRTETSEQADVDDILQDTLLQAWSNLVRETPVNFQPWLYQLTRNRCADWIRARNRTRKIDEALSPLLFVDRRGAKRPETNERVDEFRDVLRNIPSNERNALSDFYLQGFSIKEIANRQRSTSGTIKRRLSYGRDMVRDELKIPKPMRTESMETEIEKISDLPTTRPQISISKVGSNPFPIDLQELAWWFVVPKVGDSVRWAIYEAVERGTSFRLKSFHSMRGSREAEIHGRNCVEIDICEQECSDRRAFLEPNIGDKSIKVWGHLAATEVHWIAYESERQNGKRVWYTFLDEGWDQDFGVCNRSVPVDNYVEKISEGLVTTTSETPRLFGDGVFNVNIGNDGKSIECMRVFELGTTESDVLIEAFVTRTGRTILVRRYNGERWAKATGSKYFVGKRNLWSEELPNSDTLVVDGVRFVHYQDSLNVRALSDTVSD